MAPNRYPRRPISCESSRVPHGSDIGEGKSNEKEAKGWEGEDGVEIKKPTELFEKGNRIQRNDPVC